MSTIKADTVTASTTNGDLTLDGNGTGVVNLATGAKLNNVALGTAATLNVGTGANQIVQLDGSGNLPAVNGSALTNLPATGWEFVSSQFASSSADIEFTGFTSGYDYAVEMINVLPATNGVTLEAYLGISGPTYRTANYEGETGGVNVTLSTSTSTGPWSTKMVLGQTSIGNVAGNGVHAIFIMRNPGAATVTQVHVEGHHADSNPSLQLCTFSGGGRHTTAEAMDAVKFKMLSGNISEGDFYLYRRANA